MTQRRITIYANGIADFQETLHLHAGEHQEFSLPLKQEHLGDFLSSFCVFGQATISQPPTYLSQMPESGAISFAKENALEALICKLAGVATRVKRGDQVIEGTIVGLHAEPDVVIERIVTRKQLVVLTDGGLVKIPIAEMSHLEICDASAKEELEKTLQFCAGQIQQDHRRVSCTLTSEQDGEAHLRYTLPAAAWKICYRLRELSEDRIELQGLAVVDNNTQDDWNEVEISVVTGEPVTFSTDLAIPKVPHRSHINVVQENAASGVEVPRAAPVMMAGVFDDNDDFEGAVASPNLSARYDSTGAENLSDTGFAKFTPAVVDDVADFSVYHTSGTTSIGSGRSALIPLFQTEVNNSRAVLYYKHEVQPRHPYRAIEFTNSTEFTLGRGVCGIYRDETYMGNALLPTTKVGATSVLAHAVETSVHVHRHTDASQQNMTGFAIRDGICHQKIYQTQVTEYVIGNLVEQQAILMIDHEPLLYESEASYELVSEASHAEFVDQQRMNEGTRYTLRMSSKGGFKLVVKEQKTISSQVLLLNPRDKKARLNVEWLESQVIGKRGPLPEYESLMKAIDIQQKLDEKREELQELDHEIQRMEARQERLRKNIQASGNYEQSAGWRNELADAEERIVEIEEILQPHVRKSEKRIRAELIDLMEQLAIEWSES